MGGVRATSWQGPVERLDRVLPELGLARSRSQAAELISAGLVRVNGERAAKAGVRVAARSSIEVDGADHYVSRAARKLIAGLNAFGVDPAGALALDVGASTGGFTQVLLERGAREVLAVDVGHGQLADEIRADPRVRAVEGCNARDLTPQVLAERTGAEEAPGIVVGDLSFISLELVLPALLAVAAVARVIDSAASIGLACLGLIASPIAGEHGNREALAHFARGTVADRPEWEQRLHGLFDTGFDTGGEA